MDPVGKLKLRQFLLQCLAEAGDHGELADHHSLFASGRLDSLSMTRLVLFLEENFQVDFGTVDFEVEAIDSIEAMARLVAANAAATPGALLSRRLPRSRTACSTRSRPS